MSFADFGEPIATERAADCTYRLDVDFVYNYRVRFGCGQGSEETMKTPVAVAVCLLIALQLSGHLLADDKPAAPASAPTAIRIDAGSDKEVKDSAGNLWAKDEGFADGETVDRGADLKIENTQTPEIYRTERYGMTKFSKEVPNGKYTIKLHFAETSSVISAAGERVFSMNVEGKEINDFDIFAKAGGREKAYVESVDVEVTDGKLEITFTAKTQNPAINAIEILPAS